jgi:hypothetical protein
MPTSHAGHHKHQTTTGVYMPQTFHPKLASFNKSAILIFQTWAAAYNTVGGATTLSTPARDHRRAGFLTGWTKVSGLESTPIRKAREKLRVARVDRHIPRTSREKDFVSWKCCNVGLVTSVRSLEIARGRMAEITEKTANAGESNWRLLTLHSRMVPENTHTSRKMVKSVQRHDCQALTNSNNSQRDKQIPTTWCCVDSCG